MTGTLGEVVREEAARHNREIDAKAAEHIIWSHTGYPCFWGLKEGETTQDCFRRQVKEFFDRWDAGETPEEQYEKAWNPPRENKDDSA